MNKIIFDFERIGTIKDFYTIAKKVFTLPETFGNNLDALWDCITGFVELPCEVVFTNMALPQLEQFEDVITLMEDAQDELEDQFAFTYFIKKDY